jgi:site-specific recombinase XerD
MSSSQKANFSLVIYISRTKTKKNGEVPVLMKININGERVVMQLQRSVHPDTWDSKKARVGGRTNEARDLNNYIDAVITKTRQKYTELIMLNDTVSPQMLRDAVLGINTAKPKMILEIWEDHIAGMRKLIGKETSAATCQKYTTAKNHFATFLKLKYRTNDVSIKAIDHYMISQFAMYLKTERGCNYNTTNKFLQNFKRITCQCMRHGWLLKDPFGNISLSMKEVDRPYLTEEELKRLMEFRSPIDRLIRVRDFFIFSCFTGLAYIDVKQLKRNEIEGSPKVGYWIRTKRQKTSARANIPLLNVPIQIIQKYSDLELLQDEDPVIPILTNQKMNAYLKELSDMCNISKNLSFHIARHTFATTITMMNGVPIESVSKMLGHKNIKSTQHYARIVDQKVGDDMDLLSQKIGSRLFLSF